MDFWLRRVIGGMILLIAEMFVGTFDLLALGIAALLTALLSYILGIDMSQRKLASFIFLLASIAAILVSRLLVLPKVRGEDGPEPMSGEAVVGTTMTVQQVNDKLVVRYEGVYWNLESDQLLSQGDTVTVTSMHGNHLVVEKQ